MPAFDNFTPSSLPLTGVSLTGTVQIGVTNASAITKLPEGGTDLELSNQSANWVFLEFGWAATTAAGGPAAVIPVSGGVLGSYPLGPGQTKVVRRPGQLQPAQNLGLPQAGQLATHVACICGVAGPSVITITAGIGN